MPYKVAHGVSDVAVAPYPFEHGQIIGTPLKILEYMAMRCAVVAPDTENIRDLVVPDREGLLFRPDDLASLRDALSRLTGDPALRARERAGPSWLRTGSPYVCAISSTTSRTGSGRCVAASPLTCRAMALKISQSLRDSHAGTMAACMGLI